MIDLCHEHNGYYKGCDKKTATIRQQTRDLPLPMLNDVTTTYDENDDDNYRRGGLISNRNDYGGGVGLDFDEKLNKDDGQTQRAIWNGMVGTYDFFPSLYSR